nr:MAG TPA: hypothetical protein [Caudoviricetes sp.]
MRRRGGGWGTPRRDSQAEPACIDPMPPPSRARGLYHIM